MKQDMRRLIKACWIRACRWDKMPVDTKFASFSADNPYAKRHDKYMRILLAALAGQYV